MSVTNEPRRVSARRAAAYLDRCPAFTLLHYDKAKTESEQNKSKASVCFLGVFRNYARKLIYYV